MKTQKKAPKTRARSTAKRAPQKRRNLKNRPVHKRVLLHPVTVLLLLCVGVLMAGLTYRASGDSYSVTATVLAPLPPAPATISSPVDQTHFTTTPITVTGTCPENTYVELDDNSNYSGTAICGSGQTTYTIQINLSLGSNVLVAQVFNITDQAGPAGSPITVWLDNPVQPPAPVPNSTPATVQVTTQDGTGYQSGVTATVSPYVTETGTAPPYSLITVIFHSTPVSCTTYADANGNWSCTLDQPLPDGYHMVSVTATTPQGETLTFGPFRIYVSGNMASLQPAHPPVVPFLITTNYHYQILDSGKPFTLNLGLSGGVAPYAVTILWGDGRESTIARNNGAEFSVTHTYILTDERQELYTIKIEAADATGATAFLQTPEIVRGNGVILPIINNLGGNNSFAGKWSLLIWPIYLIVVLMVFSFWLGERQEHENIFQRRIIHRHRRA